MPFQRCCCVQRGIGYSSSIAHQYALGTTSLPANKKALHTLSRIMLSLACDLGGDDSYFTIKADSCCLSCCWSNVSAATLYPHEAWSITPSCCCTGIRLTRRPPSFLVPRFNVKNSSKYHSSLYPVYSFCLRLCHHQCTAPYT